MKVQVQKWGSSLALRIPKSFAVECGIEHGTLVDVLFVEGKLVVAPDPPDFTWEMGKRPTLRHTPSEDYFFTFERNSSGQHAARYSPGEETVSSYREGRNWKEQLSFVEKWLTKLKREVQAPDLWSLISEQTSLVQAASADIPNTPFSAAEIKKISDGLRELQTYIENTHQLDEQKRAFLESRLDYLVEAAGRQGRQDWLHTAIRGFIHDHGGLGDGARAGEGDIPFRR